MATWIGDFVGFLIVLWFLWRYVVPPVRKAMRKQQDAIRQQIEDSKQAEAHLATAERSYAKAVAEARTEAAKIRDDARADAEQIVEEMKAHAEQEVVRIRQRGEESLELRHHQVVRDLRAHIGELSSELAGRVVREHLADGANQTATVDRFLDELEGMAASDGEQAVTAGAAAARGEA